MHSLKLALSLEYTYCHAHSARSELHSSRPNSNTVKQWWKANKVSPSHKHTLQAANWWTGVVWITCGLLWCFYQLILTAPIHCRASIGEQVMHCYISPNLFWRRNKLIYILDGLRVSTFSANCHFWVNYSINLDLGIGCGKKIFCIAGCENILERVLMVIGVESY